MIYAFSVFKQKSQLKSDCEKEIEEIIAEIRNKYNARLQEADTRYSLRKNELGGNLKKVLLNKLLADTFRSKCNDIKPSKLPGMQQGVMFLIVVNAAYRFG